MVNFTLFRRSAKSDTGFLRAVSIQSQSWEYNVSLSNFQDFSVVLAVSIVSFALLMVLGRHLSWKKETQISQALEARILHLKGSATCWIAGMRAALGALPKPDFNARCKGYLWMWMSDWFWCPSLCGGHNFLNVTLLESWLTPHWAGDDSWSPLACSTCSIPPSATISWVKPSACVYHCVSLHWFSIVEQWQTQTSSIFRLLLDCFTRSTTS